MCYCAKVKRSRLADICFGLRGVSRYRMLPMMAAAHPVFLPHKNYESHFFVIHGLVDHRKAQNSRQEVDGATSKHIINL